MYRNGHLGINAALYAPVSYALAANDMMRLLGIGLVLMVGLVVVPDYDLRLPVVEHRGITHTVWFAALIGVASAALLLQLSLPYDPVLLGLFGFAMGTGSVLGHLVGDVLTPMGITPFEPLSDRRYSLELVYAKNQVANGGFLTVGVLLLAYATAAPLVGTVPP